MLTQRSNLCYLFFKLTNKVAYTTNKKCFCFTVCIDLSSKPGIQKCQMLKPGIGSRPVPSNTGSRLFVAPVSHDAIIEHIFVSLSNTNASFIPHKNLYSPYKYMHFKYNINKIQNTYNFKQYKCLFLPYKFYFSQHQ